MGVCCCEDGALGMGEICGTGGTGGSEVALPWLEETDRRLSGKKEKDGWRSALRKASAIRLASSDQSPCSSTALLEAGAVETAAKERGRAPPPCAPGGPAGTARLAPAPDGTDSSVGLGRERGPLLDEVVPSAGEESGPFSCAQGADRGERGEESDTSDWLLDELAAGAGASMGVAECKLPPVPFSFCAAAPVGLTAKPYRDDERRRHLRHTR